MPASSSSRSPTFWVFPVAQLLPLLWQIMSAVWSWGSSCELNHCGVLRNRMYCRQISSSVIPFGHRRVTVDDMSMMCAAGLHWFILCSTTEGWSASTYKYSNGYRYFETIFQLRAPSEWWLFGATVQIVLPFWFTYNILRSCNARSLLVVMRLLLPFEPLRRATVTSTFHFYIHECRRWEIVLQVMP